MKRPGWESLIDKIRLMWFVLVLAPVLTSCYTAPATSASKVSPVSAPPTVLTIQEPIEVVSLDGPVPPTNPRGPNLELVLKNISKEAIQSLKVTLDLNVPFDFIFDVTLPVPLLPGKTIRSEQTLIRAEFNDSTNYPLRISGAFRSGSTFDYVVEVQIRPVPTVK